MKFLALINTELINHRKIKGEFKKVIPEIDHFDCRTLGIGTRKPETFEEFQRVMELMNIDLDALPNIYQGLIVGLSVVKNDDNKPEWFSVLHSMYSNKIPIYRYKENSTTNQHSIERVDTPNEKILVINGVMLH